MYFGIDAHIFKLHRRHCWKHSKKFVSDNVQMSNATMYFWRGSEHYSRNRSLLVF